MNTRSDVERAVIGAILASENGEAKPYLRALLPEHFQNPKYRGIFEAARALAEDGTSPTASNLALSGKLPPDISEGDLFGLSIEPRGHDRPFLTRRLIDLYGVEEIRRLGMAANNGADFDELWNQLDAVSANIGRAITGIARRSKEDQVDAVNQYFQDMRAGRIRSISTGWGSLDRALRGGLSDSGLSYLVAPGGFGKTSFALAVAIHAAQSGFPVHFIQGEMTAAQTHRRGTLITQGFAPEEAVDAWAAWVAEYLRIPLRIEVLTDRTPARVLRECERAHDEGCKLVVLDYLQVFSELPEERITDAGKEFLAIRHLSRRLRQFALKTGVHVLAISARNRNEDGRKSTLSSLYGGTGLEHDCTEAFILRRYTDTLTEYEDADKKKRLEAGEQETGICPMILDIVKARDAITGPLRFTYNKRTQQFSEGWSDA